MAEVKWIKIVTDIFDDEKILLIESVPEADSIIVIWFKLLCLAGKQNNNGLIMLNDKIAYTDEMLSTVFRRPLSTVKLALATFESFGMIEMIDGRIYLPNWEKHQSVDKMAQLREYNREAKQKSRARLAERCQENVNDKSRTSQGQVIDGQGIDKDKEEDKEEDKDNIYNSVYAEIISYLNSQADTSYRASSQATRKHIHARLEEKFTVDDFKAVIDKKCAEWKGTEMEKFLRPETLFGSKFESYLNAKTNTGDSFLSFMREAQNDKV